MIPYLDLKAQYRSVATELEPAVLEVLRSCEYVLGAAVKKFEEEFATYCGAEHAIALNSGTSALHLALLALGIGPGDEVITTPMTFVATVAAIRYANARPVLVDIDPETWNIDPRRIADAITPRTKAIMPVHLHGRLADMEAIAAIARQHGIAVIEDAAQAHGARLGNRCAGTLGDIGCFSFYPGKNLGAAGEGGALVTNRSDVAERVRRLRDWGQTSRYHHDIAGYNYRMDTLQAAVLSVKLNRLPEWTARRQELGHLYDTLLGNSPVRLPARSAPGTHVYHVYAVRSPERDRLQKWLGTAGVGTNIHYPRPAHVQRAYADLGYREGDMPNAEAFGREALSLPIYPELSRESLERVVEMVRKFEPSVR
jgi:dTDP-4-amino-4,6-dideoxygalactose transaminase